MDSNCSSSDQVITKLVEMGFEHSVSEEAIKEVGPSMVDAAEFILNKSHTNNKATSSSYKRPAINKKVLGKRALTATRGSSRQTSIMDHFQPTARSKRSRTNDVSDVSVTGSETLPGPEEERKETLSDVGLNPSLQPLNCPLGVDIGADWEHKANTLLRKHFGYSSLKSFQVEALSAWVAHQDCLVLAATGSGKSLCFQIPALLTGKVVVVVSPLISLMHDQCLKLSKHGISACFLGSGQLDSSVEQKAMRGMYGIIYVCPETILRLIEPLQRLAENRGIALFAIDEVHCVSKWGHDFRPDYRRLSVLRKTFSACKLNFLKFNIPLMALTATATLRVREDILKSLSMLKETKIVVTSFFRPNLRFEVKHSRTSSPSSYETDFRQLIDIYTKKRKNVQQKHNMGDATDGSSNIANGSISEEDVVSLSDVDDNEDSNSDDEENSRKENYTSTSMDKQMSVEYLEDEADDFQSVDDWDVACAEFQGQSLAEDRGLCGLPKTFDPPINPEERLKLLQGPLEHGPTIIYVPTRKQTLSIAKYLCQFGIKAAAYNASLPKSHLRQVHKDFHENALEVIVATIAFGMGIDKLNVRRIIHYGWPQSLEAYYQEAGRAGRDGKLADCVLYANLSRMPSLLPSKRSEEQTKQSYKMLSDCYRYGMNTSCCRAKILVEYFGEEFADQKCLLCDVCVNGPPERQNLKEEADILLQIIAAYYEQHSCVDYSYEESTYSDTKQRKPDIRMFVSKIREQFPKFTATDQLWWRGLSRILENKGYIREADDKIHVMIKFPEPTKLGLDFLQCKSAEEGTFYVYPEADMLLGMKKDKPYSTFADWGKGWADPEIRRQRLLLRRSKRKPRQRKSRKHKDPNTVRGRLTSKLSKCK